MDDTMVEARRRRMEAALAGGDRDAWNRAYLWRLEGLVVHVSGARVRVVSGQHRIEPTANDLRRARAYVKRVTGHERAVLARDYPTAFRRLDLQA